MTKTHRKPYETPLLRRLTLDQAIAMWQRSRDPRRAAWAQARLKLLERIEGRPGWRIE